MKYRTILVSAVSVTPFLASAAFAQSAIAEQPLEARHYSDPAEILVTATKRSESLQDVSLSIGVVGGEFMEKYDVADIADLQGYVPSLSVQNSWGNWSFRIRGMGSGAVNLAFDMSVGLFKDGVNCGLSRCFETGFLDVQRIEVARGPQGALFGKSTIAGAISVISNEPTSSFEGKASLSTEFEYGGHTGELAISGPISDTVRGRFAFKAQDIDGFMNNPLLNRKDGSERSYAMRGIVDADLAEGWTVNLKAEKSEGKTKGHNMQARSPGVFGALTPDRQQEYVFDLTHRMTTGLSKETYGKSKTDSVTLTLDGNIGESSVVAILNNSNLNAYNLVDLDMMQGNFLWSSPEYDYNQKSAEIRLLSPTKGFLEYIVGATYQRTNTAIRQMTSSNFFGTPTPVGQDRQFSRIVNSVSAYGQFTVNATERLRLIGDLRYTTQQTKANYHMFPGTFNDLRFTYNPTAFLQGPEFEFSEKRRDRNFDPSVHVEFDLADDIMSYIGYSTGSKPGGMVANDGALGRKFLTRDANWRNTYAGGATAADLANGIVLKQGNKLFDFEDETSRNIELGLRTKFRSAGVVFNLTLFDQKFKNLQVSTYDGTNQIVGNAASVKARGIEVDATWTPTPGLNLGAAASVLDAKYAKYFTGQCQVANVNGAFKVPGCIDGQADLSGVRLELAPKWELNLNADYSFALLKTVNADIGVTYYHNDGYESRDDAHPLGTQESYNIWGARIEISDATRGFWKLALVGRNLTNEIVKQYSTELAGMNYNGTARGRTVTLEGTISF